MSTDPAFRLPPASVDTILGALHDLQPRDTAPRISMWLRSGQRLTGSLIAYAPASAKQNAPRGVVVIKDDRGHDITYVTLPAIEALTVHLTPETLHVVSLGSLRPQRAPGATPGRLALRRKLGEIAERLAASGWTGALEVAWDDLPDAAPIRAAIDDALDDIETAMIAISNDALGAAALTEQVQRVTLTAGDATEVSLREGTLRVAGTVEVDQVHWPVGAALRNAIEKAL